MSSNEKIGELIRRARLDAGVSQRSLARRAGTSQAAVSRIERGIEQPGPQRVDALLASLGLRLRYELEPLAEHEAEPRRLIEQSRKTPQERFDEGLVWEDFLRELDLAGRAARA
ncbi:MAG: helix-turn-helix transcriptional regulator [Thermoleophilaceae bacterium]